MKYIGLGLIIWWGILAVAYAYQTGYHHGWKDHGRDRISPEGWKRFIA